MSIDGPPVPQQHRSPVSAVHRGLAGDDLVRVDIHMREQSMYRDRCGRVCYRRRILQMMQMFAARWRAFAEAAAARQACPRLGVSMGGMERRLSRYLQIADLLVADTPRLQVSNGVVQITLAYAMRT